MNEEELRNLMYTAQLDKIQQPFSIRYPRGNGVMPEWRTPFSEIEIGTGRIVKEGHDVAILSIGHVGNLALDAANKLDLAGISTALYDLRFVKPLDEKLLHQVFSKFSKIITVEDGTVVGGMGSAVLEFMAQHHYSAEITMLGMPDAVVEHGEQSELYTECGYDTPAIMKAIALLVGKKVAV
jgi:1-deoxy-D-xylulose-5-phosphate synthase